MTGRYIPPALRARGDQQVGEASTRDRDTGSTLPPSGPRGGYYSRPLTSRSDAILDGDDLCSPKEIDRHFWPVREYEDPGTRQKTLHDSAATPGVVSYVLLFKDANPRWDEGGIIFTKSSLDLLPADLADKSKERGAAAADGICGEDDKLSSTSQDDRHESGGGNETSGQEHGEAQQQQQQGDVAAPSTTSPKAEKLHPHPGPIAVFSQVRRTQFDSSRSFKFAGYYRIVRLTFLQPHSPDLVRMLEQKWSLRNPRTGQVRQRQRDAGAWQESLKMKWAVVKFERDEEAMKSLGELKIERLDDDDDQDGGGDGEGLSGGANGGHGRRMSGRKAQRKGVNEMLRELRMGEGEANKEKNEREQEEKGTPDDGDNGGEKG
ncbi:hypothetical protein Z517_06306 [Fonsecaea pedrosoi CBS 271.37]|uniref:Uncharacterized protein n=1 Tax=Fonsecaea pedrosoi CBS 271.37 TaxID=1442368 RepID=A0A0D2EZ99_9EURO|nr:uncharacterized protein Z517_06306 [Fonsecaea pedrosoi CBS 271.37]KIW79692.1 hypothetical protein Z517_06306 [Fonsecaea pedrosoi CBS 271.37]